MGPGIFYSDDAADQIRAIEICVECPVMIPCLEYAISIREDHGIWGALGESARRHLVRIHRTGDALRFHRAMAAEIDALSVRVAGDPDERKPQPARVCERCFDLIEPGVHPRDDNGPGATCGHTSTYNKGCRCFRCCVAKSKSYERATIQRNQSSTWRADSLA